MQSGAAAINATIILVDVGTNLGALNRSALIATDHVIAPLAADLFSLRGLRNLGPALARWRSEWSTRRARWNPAEFSLPQGGMRPAGYIVQQHGVRLGRPVRAYDKWVNRRPEACRRHLLECNSGPFPDTPDNDQDCLAIVRHYRSLVPMAQEARKPVFSLTAADGAIGNHAVAVSNAYRDFRCLAKIIRTRVGLST